MKKSLVSYGIILNLKPFLRKNLCISKRCWARQNAQSTFLQVNGYQTPSHFPLAFSFTLHTYVCYYLEESQPLSKLLSSSISSCSCCLTSLWRRNQDNDLGRVAHLFCRLDGPPTCPETSGHIHLPSMNSPLHLHFPPSPPKTRALLEVGGVVTRTAAVQGAELLLIMITLLL